MALASGAVSYLRNVAKSFKYSTADLLKDNTPYLNSLFKESKETVNDLYSSIKDFSSGKGAEIKSMGKEALDSIFKNLKEDLRTGNFYNKERDQVFDNEMMKLMGFDMEEFDFDFDEDSFDFGSDTDDITDGDELIVKQNAKNTAATIMAVDKVGAKVAEGVNKGTAASANYIVNSTRAMNTAMFKLNSKGFATITEALATLNKNTISMNEAIAKPLTTFMQNGTIFFTQTTETLNKIAKNLEELVARTPDYKSKKSGSSSRDKSLASIMSGDGFSMSAYKDFVTGNIREYTDLITGLTGMISGKGKLSDLAKGWSPLRMATKAVVGSIVPREFTKALKDFDSALEGFIPSMIAKAMSSTKGSNSILGSILREIFLPKNDLKRTIDTSRYNKGPIPFDGETKKAITDVIPKYLAYILSAINGSEPQFYDYGSGSFTTRKSIAGMKLKREKRYAEQAGGELRSDALRMTNDKKVQAEIEKYFMDAFLSGEDFTDLMQKGFRNNNKYGKNLSPQALRILRRLVVSGNYNKFPAQLMTARADMSRAMQALSESGLAPELALFDNSHLLAGKKGKGGMGSAIGGVDKYGNTVFDYLRGIYVNTLYSAGGGGSVRGGKGKVKMPDLGINYTRILKDEEKEKHDTNGKTPTFTSKEEKEAYNAKLDKEIKRLAEQIGRLTARNAKAPTSSVTAQIEKLSIELEDKKKQYVGLTEGQKEARAASLGGFNKLYGRLSEGSDKTKQAIREGLKKVLPDAVIDFLDRPINAVTKLLNSLTNSMHELLFGDGTTDGVFDILKKKISNAIDESPFLSGIKKFFMGDKENGEDGLWTRTKEGLKEYWNWMKSGVKESWDVNGSAGARYMDINLPSANGRRITKTGMIAVSEGELVIPAEMNPFYRKSINKRQQYRNEANAMRKFYGLYANGGEVEYGDDDIAKYISKNSLKKTLIKIKDPRTRNETLTRLWSHFNKSGDRIKIAGKVWYRDKDGTWHNKQEGSIGRMLSDGLDEAGNILKEGASKAVPEAERKKFSEALDKLGPEMKAAKGRIGAGFLIGGGIGGILGGPLVGALVGSVAGFVSKSETAQNILFGEVDPKTGERKGGLFSKNMSNFLTKIAPEMARGGTIGLLAGAATIGGPIGMIGGLLAGTAIGFAKKSGKAQEFLFGKIDEKGKQKGGLFDRKKFQKALPRGIIGAGAGMLLGPVGGAGGLFINMVLGAGLGFLTTNEKVHKFLFGSEKDGKKIPGLLGKLSNRIFGGLHDLFANVGIQLKLNIEHLGKFLITKAGNLKAWFSGWLEKRKAIRSGNVRRTALRKIGSGLLKVGAAGALLPMLGPLAPFIAPALGITLGPRAIANMKMRGGLRHGRNVYSRKLGRNLTAAERMAFRDKSKFTNNDGKWDQFDKSLVGMKYNDLQQASELLSSTDASTREGKQVAEKNVELFYKAAQKQNDNMDTAEMENLAGYIRKGNVDEVKSYLNRFGITGNTAKQAIKSAENVQAKQNADKDRLDVLKKRFGIKSAKDITKAQELIKTELDSKTPAEKQLEATEGAKTAAEKAAEYLEDLVNNGIWLRRSEKKKKNKKQSNGKDNNSNDQSAPVDNVIDNLDSPAAEYTPSGGTLNPNAKDGEESVVPTEEGPIKYKFSKAKGWFLNLRDKFTKRHTEEEDNVDKSNIASHGILSKISSGLTKFKNSLFGNKEDKKESIFDKIKKVLFSGGTIAAGITMLPALLPTLGKVFKWFDDKLIPFLRDDLWPTIKNVWKNLIKPAWNDVIKPAAKCVLKILNYLLTKDINDKGNNYYGNTNAIDNIRLEYDGKSLSAGFKSIDEYNKFLDWADKNYGELNVRNWAAANPTAVKIDTATKKGVTLDQLDILTDEEKAAGQKAKTSDYVVGTTTHGSWSTIGNWINDDKQYTVYEDVTKSPGLGATAYIIKDGKRYYGYFANGKFQVTSLIGKEHTSQEHSEDEVSNMRKLKYTSSSQGLDVNENGEIDYSNADFDPYYGKWSVKGEKQNIYYGRVKDSGGNLVTSFYYIDKHGKQVRVVQDWLWNSFTVSETNRDGYDWAKDLNVEFDSKDKGKVKKAPSYTVQDLLYGGKGSGLRGAGSNFVSQLDPRYANKRFGESTVGKLGCGPAVASMISSLYGNHLSMDDAINAGQNFTTSNGTDISYFSSVLKHKGISTSIAGPDQIVNDLSQSKPVILLGRDRKNTSKAYSPFGPTNHYVVATGFDKSGKLIVNDPELSGTRSYDPRILKSTMMGLSTSRSGGAASLNGFVDKTNQIFLDNGLPALTQEEMDQKMAEYKKDVELYEQSPYVYKSAPVGYTPTINQEANGNGEVTSETEESKSILDVISDLFSNFFNGLFSAKFNILSNKDTYDKTSARNELVSAIEGFKNSPYGYNYIAPTGSYSIYNPPANATADQKISDMLKYANSIIGKEKYTNDSELREIGEKYSDCSSFAKRMYKTYLGVNIGGDTTAQWSNIKDDKLSNVKLIDYNPGNRGPVLSKLRKGDLVYFMNKNYRGGKYDNVSHVEIYNGNGQLIGQRGGYGPQLLTFNKDSNMFSTGLWDGSPTKKALDEDGNEIKAPRYDRYLGAARFTGSGSGLTSRAYDRLIGGASALPTTVTSKYRIAVPKSQSSLSSSSSNRMLEQLVSAILEVLTKIVDIDIKDSANIATITTNSGNLALLGKISEGYKSVIAENEKANSQEVNKSYKALSDQVNALLAAN